MHIIFLKFGPNRAQAGQWMDEHLQWIQQGLDDGAFFMAGSLEHAQGGVVLAANTGHAEIQKRVELDPFVIHGVVSAEIFAVAPSRMAHGMASILDGAKAAMRAP